MQLADITDLVLAAPVAFLVGVAVGLLLSSRFRIVKKDEPPK